MCLQQMRDRARSKGRRPLSTHVGQWPSTAAANPANAIAKSGSRSQQEAEACRPVCQLCDFGLGPSIIHIESRPAQDCAGRWPPSSSLVRVCNERRVPAWPRPRLRAPAHPHRTPASSRALLLVRTPAAPSSCGGTRPGCCSLAAERRSRKRTGLHLLDPRPCCPAAARAHYLPHC